jgi:type 1 fimbriae regulatory protein FimB
MSAANVVVLLAPKPRREKRGRMDFLSPTELLAVLRAAREHSTRTWAMALLAYRHGLRAGEVCALKLADVDLKNNSISVRRLKGSLHTTQQLTGHRGEPLLDEIAALKSWLRERPVDSGDALFVSQKGGHLTSGQLWRIFKVVAERAGLPASKAHPHILKHSLASHLVGANVNLAVVQQFLGHRSISSTMKYIAVSDTQASEAAHSALMNIF